MDHGIDGVRSDLLEIGPRLQQALLPAAIAQAAEELGIAQRTMRRYISGNAVPPLELLTWVAQEHALSLDWLLTGRGTMRIADQVGSHLRTASLAELCRALNDRLAVLREMDPADACPYPACPLVDLVDARLREESDPGGGPECDPAPDADSGRSPRSG